MGSKLIQKDYQDAAKELGCSVAAIKAVALVESGGRGGFDEKGRVLIRFEGHKFRLFTKGKYNQSNPKVSYAYHKSHKNCGNIHGYTAFNEAMKLDAVAAMKSCSIGMFQPMVFNYHEMDFASTEEMWESLEKGEREQLFAFVRLIKQWGLADELRRATLADFAGFAKRYNGADYKANKYDTKMFFGFKKYSAEKPLKTKPVVSTLTTPDEGDGNIDIQVNAPDANNQTGTADGTQAAGVIVNAGSTDGNIPEGFTAEDKIQLAPAPSGIKDTIKTWFKGLIATASGGSLLALVKEYYQTGNVDLGTILGALGAFIAANFLIIAVILGVIAICYFIYEILSMREKQKSFRMELEFKARPDRNNVTVIPVDPTPLAAAALSQIVKPNLASRLLLAFKG